MIIKYVTSDGRKVNLNKEPYKMLVSDLIDYEWEVFTQANKITGFGYGVKRKKLNIDVHRWLNVGARENMNILTDVFESDLHKGSPGRIYINNQYMNCFIVSSGKKSWESDNIVQCEYELVTDTPFWITEHHIQLLPSYKREAVGDGLGFPFDFPYDFTRKNSGIETDRIDHYKNSDFKMIFYGPCIDPLLKVNEHPYQIFTTLKEEEYLEIDSRTNSIYKYSKDGKPENIYNSRSFENSVFEKIPSGGINLIWDGEFGIDITVYIERSEPKW